MYKYEKLTIELVEEAIKELNIQPMGYVGNGLYCIGQGTYTNEKGYREFLKHLIKWI